jgi:hypothetical protein
VASAASSRAPGRPRGRPRGGGGRGAWLISLRLLVLGGFPSLLASRRACKGPKNARRVGVAVLGGSGELTDAMEWRGKVCGGYTRLSSLSLLHLADSRPSNVVCFTHCVCVAANLWEENRIMQGAVELPRKPC